MRVLLRDLTPGQDYLMKFRSNNGMQTSEWSKVYTITTIGDTTPPKDPTDLEWKPTGESFVASWTAPTLDGNNKTLKDLKDYEVTVRATSNSATKVYYTVDASFEFTLVMNQQAFGGIELEVEITVKSRDNSGNKSAGVKKIAIEDTPPVPSTPVITNTSGLIAVEWDGSTSLGTINPFNLSYIEIHASTTNNFTPADTTLVGRFEGWVAGKQRTVITGLTYGTVHYFKLVSVNKKGKKSNPSPQASGTPVRISGLDIQNGTITTAQINFASQLGGGKAWYQTTAPTTGDGAKDFDTWYDTDDGYHPRVMVGGVWMEARDATIAAATTAASNAQTSANGKNTITYSVSAPVLPGNAGTRTGDIWFVRNAGTGVITAQYEWDGAAWNTRTLDNAVIANLDAGKITAGTLDANRISAGTITADKLTVAAKSDDLADNGRFSDLNTSSLPLGWTLDTGTGFTGATYATSTTAADIGSGTRALRLNNAANNGARAYTTTMIPAAAGEKIGMQAWIKGSQAYAANAYTLEVLCYDSAGAALTTQVASTGAVAVAPALYTGSVTLPANTKQIRFSVTLVSNASARSIFVSDLQARRQVGAVMIADGAVTATKINAGAVTADAVGTNLIITAAANIGNAVIDDAKIANVKAGKIVADDLATNTIISNTAQIKDAIISSAKIISITADKITTGSLQANQKIIAGPAGADHAEMTSTGFRVYAADALDGIPNEVIRMGTDTNDFLGIVAANGTLVGSWDDTGQLNSRRVVTDSLAIAGRDISSMLADQDRKALGRFYAAAPSNIGGIYSAYGIAETAGICVAGRSYEVSFRATYYTNVADDGVAFKIRYVGGTAGDTTTQPASPNNSSAELGTAFAPGSPVANLWIGFSTTFTFNCTSTSRYRWLLTLERSGGGSALGTIWIPQGTVVEVILKDIGPTPPASGGWNNAGGTLYGGSASTPPPSTAQQYYVDLAPTSFVSYRGDGSQRTDYNGIVQGWDPSGSNGEGGGFWMFGGLPSITGTVDRVDFYSYTDHWYYNSGGTAILNIVPSGVGNNWNAFKLRSDFYVSGYAKPGGKEVTLPSDWWPQFRNTPASGGRAFGISVGRGGGTNLTYYGRFQGPSARLRIYYTQ